MVRWAYDDPNPVAIDAIKRADQDIMYALLKAKGISVQSSGYQYPAHYDIPEAKRLKLENGVDVTEERPDLAYPDTDAQYPVDDIAPATGGSDGKGGHDEENSIGNYYETYVKQYGEHYVEAGSVVDDSKSADGNDSFWEKHVDENTGATYYFNTETGESSWTKVAEACAVVSK
jgi:hypothetical protein